MVLLVVGVGFVEEVLMTRVTFGDSLKVARYGCICREKCLIV